MFFIVFFFKQKTAYEMRISDWSSDVCSSDLEDRRVTVHLFHGAVDVARRSPRAVTPTLRLQPGGTAVLDPNAQPRLIPKYVDAPDDWPKGMVEFRRPPLADVIAQVNQIGRTSCRAKVCQ